MRLVIGQHNFVLDISLIFKDYSVTQLQLRIMLPSDYAFNASM